MTRADDTILEFLLNSPNDPLIATPRVIEANIEYKIATVRTRIRELYQAGLVDYVNEEQALYTITDKGRAYLSGELDAADLERSDDEG